MINPENGERLSTWTFSSSDRISKTDSAHSSHAGLKPRDCEIEVCIDMILGDSNQGYSRFLVVGLNDGQICVFGKGALL